MTKEVFGPSYANAYDAIYADKNYGEECDFIEAALRRNGIAGGSAILDLGCGTGGHALPLARLGYRVTGVDRAPAMIDIARKKAVDAGVDVVWEVGDVRSSRVAGTFDAAILMFAVLGYQIANDDVRATLGNARRHLRAGGTLVFDVWYGAAVLREGPGDRVRVIDQGARQLVRAVSSVVHDERNVVDVRIRTWELHGAALGSRSDEVHPMRFFSPVELDLLLTSSGFGEGSYFAFPSVDRPPDPHRWSLGCVAVAREARPD